jgi:hypothetical protein
MVELPPAFVMLDKGALLKRYRRGHAEVLPVLKELNRATVEKDALLTPLRSPEDPSRSVTRAKTPKIGKRVTRPPPLTPQPIRTFESPSENGSRVAVSARVNVSSVSTQDYGYLSGPSLGPDALADAVCERFPELRNGSPESVKRRAYSVDVKRYSCALRPKLVAPLGEVENSVVIFHG